MAQEAASEADWIACIVGALAVYGAAAFAFALTIDVSAASAVSTLHAVAFIVAAVLMAVVSGYVMYRARQVEARDRARTRLVHVRQAERNATIISDVSFIVSFIDILLTALAAGGAVVWRDALSTAATLSLVALVWYGASTIPYAPLPRYPEDNADDVKTS